jgi:hypothetical protein
MGARLATERADSNVGSPFPRFDGFPASHKKKGRARALGVPTAYCWVPGWLLIEGRTLVMGVPTGTCLGARLPQKEPALVLRVQYEF